MAYCTNCGKEISDHAAKCSECGAYQQSQQVYRNVAPDTGGFGWGLLGFCVPIAGLVLYLVWMHDRPRTAKAAGLGALISVIGIVLFYIVYFIFIAVLISTGSTGY
jgi:DNA-directed RNA polymerase subunit RPC12/RpoP